MLVDRPNGFKPFGCKWVYKCKIGADWEVTTFKAMLVAKRYTQRPRVNFGKTFSSVAIAKCLRIVLTIATWYDYEIWRMAEKIIFFNGFVEEEIYIDQSEGYMVIGEEQKGYDFAKNDFDPCIYMKISGSPVALLVLYVDDIFLIGNDVKMLGDTKAWLSTQFSMKDLGEASYILGIKIISDRSRRIKILDLGTRTAEIGRLATRRLSAHAQPAVWCCAPVVVADGWTIFAVSSKK
ncbi:UNVERIFIED_CONTAM: Retrovirus-related Pol polyprotein from transposon TNT 1-94 [Sesamum angustifolium]|uniref:Retrovirus-related Pol polyprotein from transposon TNT 1-94 n=1 Tax=Sesamum angustifolium TaxID=2727405 RepID=A0AAW2JG84_9LAMI